MLVKSMREIIKSWGFKRHEYFDGVKRKTVAKNNNVYTSPPTRP